MKYRAEIDGLRALAVVPVILFHAGFELFSGGFVGVDVFFVISGYLITTILIQDVEANSFSLIKFYQRRARRILPALTAVCIATIPFSYSYLGPSSFTDYGKSLMSVSAFVSNVYFALSGGYFAEYVAAKPLLHTWSLSVEEQFYIVFPFVILMCARFRRLNLTFIISILSLLSITLAILLVDIYPRIAFFGLPTRAWELGVGALIASLNRDVYITNRLYGNVAGVAGIALLAASYILISADNLMPGIAAIPPVVGAALLIVSPSTSIAAKLLSNKILVGIGLISYSLYLWHQPVLSFGHIVSESLMMTLVLIALALFLSIISWKYVESPFRDREFIKDKFILPISLISLVILGAAGWIISSNDGFSQRFPTYEAYKSSNTWGEERNVDNECVSKYGGDQYCLVNDVSADLTDLLIGDSHANHFYPGLAERLAEKDRNLLMIGAGGCPPLIDIDMGFHYVHGRRLRCMDRVNDEYMRLLENDSVAHVYLAFAQDTLFDERLDFTDYRGELNFYINREDAVFNALMRTIRLAQENGKMVSVLMDLPDNTHQTFLTCLMSQNTELACIEEWQLKSMNISYLKLLERLDDEGVNVIDTSFALNQFPLLSNGDYLYRDGTHLSLAGSLYIGENIVLSND